MNELEIVPGKVFEVIGVVDAVIAQMDAKYLSLTIADQTDKKGYEEVKAGKMVYVHQRTKVEKEGLRLRKAAKSSIEDYLTKEQTEEKRILALLKPGEDYLTGIEKVYLDDLEAIRLEKVRQEELRIQGRVDRLESFGMGLKAGHYQLDFNPPGIAVPVALLKVCSDDQFEQFCGKIQEAVQTENERLNKIAVEAAVEKERLAKVADDQETERLRLEKIANDIVETERKKRVQEAIEQSARDKQADDLRAAQEKVDDDKSEFERMRAEQIRLEIAAEKREARRPDKERLLAFAANDFFIPACKTQDGIVIVNEFKIEFDRAIKNLCEKAERL